ncbi:MAG: HAMP domain-containing histidine kinase, partial [Lachnospiraceae bacterium]|nr:HAMP domain-containing histidine kinase [Lachnospiraceae bacterium]
MEWGMYGQVNDLNSEMTWIVTGTIIGILIGLSVMRWYDNRRVNRFTASLSNTLDRMVAQEEITFSICHEMMEDKLNLKLKRLYEILMDKTKKSEQEKENLKGLVADITHQVRTPIANIKMYHSIMMERELEKEKQKEFLALTDAQIGKLEFFLDALVKMSRLESGAITLQLKKQEVKPALAQALSGIVLKAEQKKMTVSVECDSFLTAVFDKKWTAEALFNVLDNAVKYAKEGGTIWVGARKEEFYTVI